MNIEKIKRLKKIGLFTVGGILSGIIGNLIKREPALSDFQVSAIAGLSAGVIMEIFDEESPNWRQRRRFQRHNALPGSRNCHPSGNVFRPK